MSPGRAGWKAMTNSPQSVVNGVKAYGKSIIEEIKETYKIKRLAKEYEVGTALRPRAVVNAAIQLKQIEKDMSIEGIRDERIALATKGLDPATDAEKIAKLTAEIEAEFAKGANKADQAKVLWRLRMTENLLDSAKGSVSGLRLLKYMGPQAALSLAADASLMILGESLIEGHNARLRARQCAKIFPLMSGRFPFVAGIRGHQGAVIGDDVSWVDELISNLHGVNASTGKGILDEGGIAAFGWIAALGGVELPKWGETEVDTAYLQVYGGK
jgi:hypothetical protein